MVVFTTLMCVASIPGGNGTCAGDGAAGVAATAGTESAVTVVGSSVTGGNSFDAISDATSYNIRERAEAGPMAACAVTVLGGLGSTALLVLGASNNSKEDGTTFDCWKPVIHDESKEPSRGMLLKDIYSHPNVLRVTTTEGYHPDLPRIVIENIWNEVFEIQYLWVHATGNIICHALPI